MTPKGHVRVTILALNGRKPYVMSRTHRESVWAFPKGTNGCLIGTVTNAETVDMACGRVGLQRRLVDA